MLVLRFETEAAWRECCDGSEMRRRWGRPLARRISRRLQQIEAMDSLDDLAFMPFGSAVHADGTAEVELDDDMSLFLRPVAASQEDGQMPATHVLVSVGSQSMAVI